MHMVNSALTPGQRTAMGFVLTEIRGVYYMEQETMELIYECD